MINEKDITFGTLTRIKSNYNSRTIKAEGALGRRPFTPRLNFARPKREQGAGQTRAKGRESAPLRTPRLQLARPKREQGAGRDEM